MGNKNQSVPVLRWQATNPATGFLPNNPAQYGGGSNPSGTAAGAMASTNTIYTNILEVSRMDNVGLEVTWTGTPTGTFQVMGSNSGVTFYALTFNPVLNQPAGSAGGYLIDLTQYPFKYLLLQYTNASGSGSITVFTQTKDLN